MTLKDFEQIGKRGFYRPIASLSFEQAIDLVAGAMRTARSLELTDLLVNAKGLTGFASPSVFGRYTMAVEWARSTGSALRVALVVRQEMMDPQKIAVLMAQNRGVAGDAFLDEAAALAWLDGHLANATGILTAPNPVLKPPL
jgi:hypothetical protein